MKNINFLIEQVLNNVDFCTEHTEIIEDNDNYICDNFDGFANEDLLLKIVQASSQNENVARFLSAYVIHLSQKEITPCVFNAILSISSKYRKSILIGLSHCNLSYYQLVNLNKLQIEEALIQLIRLVFKYDCFTEYDLRMILDTWNYKIPQYVYESFSTKEQYVIKKIIKNHT